MRMLTYFCARVSFELAITGLSSDSSRSKFESGGFFLGSPIKHIKSYFKTLDVVNNVITQLLYLLNSVGSSFPYYST